MADQDALERDIAQRLTAAAERNRREQRHATFAETARRLTADIVRPRVEKLVTFFDNARLCEDTGLERDRCGCSFSHSPRFPATVHLDFSVGHDEQIETLILSCDLDILPVF